MRKRSGLSLVSSASRIWYTPQHWMTSASSTAPMYLNIGTIAEKPRPAKVLEIRQEYANRRKTHDHHGHFHHNIVALLEEVRYQLGLILQLGEDNADDQCKHDNLRHFTVGERTDRVFRMIFSRVSAKLTESEEAATSAV